MARLKQTIYQRDFSLGELREDFLEGDDLELRQASLKNARNVRVLATRAIEERPGTFYERTLTNARQMMEIRPAAGLTYALIVSDDGLDVIDGDADIIWSASSVPWTDGAAVWVEGFRSEIVLGGAWGIYRLTYDDGAWTFTEFAFAGGPGGELMQPYWSYDSGTTIQPTGISGTVYVDAVGFTWTAAHIGLRVRYNYREILITALVTTTRVEGTVVNSLPPSFDIDVVDATEFRVNDAVVSAENNYQGLIVEITSNTLKCVTLGMFEGPVHNEVLSGPSGSSKVDGHPTKIVAPYASTVWDEPLMSDIRGWPQAGGVASGRLFLANFPQAESVIAASSTRSIDDFSVGSEDDDAIAQSVGDNSPRWLHIVNMGDLVLFADTGCYIVNTRDSGLLTPSTFNAVLVDQTGASSVRPVRLKDGVVFVEANGRSVSAMVLDGNVYLKWSVKTLTRFHDQLIKTPTYLCGPAQNSQFPEKYVSVINSDGTLAVLSFQENIREERIGFVPWDTDGSFAAMSPLFNQYWAIVNRTVNGSSVQMLERFSLDAAMDSVVETGDETASDILTVNGDALEVNGVDLEVNGFDLAHLASDTVTIYARGWTPGEFDVTAAGLVDGEPVFSGTRQYGKPFTVEVAPWPMEVIDSPRIGLMATRVLQMVVSVQNSLGFDTACNSYTSTVGDYLVGADLTEPPDFRTQVYRFSIFGNRDHPSLSITRSKPGPLRILAIGQRITA